MKHASQNKTSAYIGPQHRTEYPNAQNTLPPVHAVPNNTPIANTPQNELNENIHEEIWATVKVELGGVHIGS